MLRTLLTLLFVSALALTGALGLARPSAAAAIAPATTNAAYGAHSLNGSHGFSYDGSARGLGPVASSGRIDFDGAGNLQASFTTSVAGIAFQGTFLGSYNVNADGSGSILVDLPWLATQAHGDFVIVEHGAGTFFTATDPGYSVSGRTARM